ncbi:MAG: hypothetical protein IPJ61_14630 [Tessaracoccus sp.]|uniref:alpha-amylase family glycosyl hydrolase n=1 Tax=Tessaracoccus sp. TaxID=1971211 RepID=UPI001ED3BB08|nr:alpha-amylase family glycosyl hydrolase [Tessaracoccus sp.]MBK7822249.1 hypothetical protein [Tessaracoccus sp.]
MPPVAIPEAPAWAKDLVMYQLNPRTFTSPDGAGAGDGSGTFASMRERLPYLRRVGVNGIWMAGHHLATAHFYGIWSVYAALEPQTIDPVLGTPDEFRELVRACHAQGIRLFLDVIAHGVLHESPLVAEHPDWFPSSSWGMADYDYANPEFRAWWKDLWLTYALEYDVDGFRIDVDMGDPSLWAEIVLAAREAGKELVVFPENERFHFSQQEIMGAEFNPVRALHVRDFLKEPRGLAAAQLSCHDYGWQGLPGNHYYLKGSRALAAHGALLAPRIPIFLAGEEFDADPAPVPNLTQGLFGDGGPGGWMYGNRVDWVGLDDPSKKAMLDDVTEMLSLRRRFLHLINGDSSTMAIAAVPYDGRLSHAPFALGNGTEAIIVAVNNTSEPVSAQIQVPRGDLGVAVDARLRVVDLLSGESVELGLDDRCQVDVAADYEPRGGYRALHVTLADDQMPVRAELPNGR